MYASLMLFLNKHTVGLLPNPSVLLCMQLMFACCAVGPSTTQVIPTSVTAAAAVVLALNAP